MGDLHETFVQLLSFVDAEEGAVHQQIEGAAFYSSGMWVSDFSATLLVVTVVDGSLVVGNAASDNQPTVNCPHKITTTNDSDSDC